jgi:hypothetical protein
MLPFRWQTRGVSRQRAFVIIDRPDAGSRPIGPGPWSDSCSHRMVRIWKTTEMEQTIQEPTLMPKGHGDLMVAAHSARVYSDRGRSRGERR